LAGKPGGDSISERARVGREPRGCGLDILGFTLLLLVGSFVAGFLGALTGLGGGVVIVPLLVLAFGIDLRYAIGASLISVIATSSGAAAYVKEGLSNLRVGIFLEMATTVGAVSGASLATFLDANTIGVVFALVLLYSIYAELRPHKSSTAADRPDALATRLRMDSTYPSPAGSVAYHVHRVPAGFAIMWVAGALSGLLGIGSGMVKVLAMDQAMRIPLKVSTTTSNFMIGVTAAASAGIYLQRGYIEPGLAMPVMLGVLAGSLAGSAVLPRAPTTLLRWVFCAVMAAAAVEMLINSLAGRI
jgi:uncharacterized membrane protein YfcA